MYDPPTMYVETDCPGELFGLGWPGGGKAVVEPSGDNEARSPAFPSETTKAASFNLQRF